jgi:hypothetical protein
MKGWVSWSSAALASVLGMATACDSTPAAPSDAGEDVSTPTDAGQRADVPAAVLDAGTTDVPSTPGPDGGVADAPVAADGGSSDASTGPRGEIIARDQDGAFAIAVDATHVYWTNYNGATVMRMPKAGGTPQMLASGFGGTAIAVDGSTVYAVAAHNLYSLPTTGGTPAMLATATAPAGLPFPYLALNAGWVVFGGGTALRAVPRAAGSAAGVPLPCPQCTVEGFALDATHVYYSIVYALNRGTYRWAFGAGGPEQLSTANGRSLALDDTHAYLGNVTEPSIVRLPKATGASPETVVASAGAVGQLAVAGGYVYWTTGDSEQGSIARAPTGGGATQVVVSGTGVPWHIALDDSFVYWTDQVHNQVGRARRDPGAAGP